MSCKSGSIIGDKWSVADKSEMIGGSSVVTVYQLWYDGRDKPESDPAPMLSVWFNDDEGQFELTIETGYAEPTLSVDTNRSVLINKANDVSCNLNSMEEIEKFMDLFKSYAHHDIVNFKTIMDSLRR